MQLQLIDWVVVGAYGVITLVGCCMRTALAATRRSIFFPVARYPGGLLGTSMVATTFSADTPNIVTNLNRCRLLD